jgi:hypothetical protein
MKKLDWFLRDWRRNESVKMDPELIDLVWEVQQEVGAKKPIWIICGYRAPATNSMLRARSRNSGVANNSMHTIGRAIDFYIPDASLEELRIAGIRFQRGGVGYYPSSGSPFVHMDTSSVRHWPRMSRDQLARVFPNGRTVHIPSDGQPLSGYALALADVEKRGGSASQTSVEAARVAGVSTDAKPRAARNLLASLFGVKDKEEDDDVATTASVAARPAVKPVAIKPVAVKRDVIASLVEKQDVVRPAPATLPAPRRGVPEALEHATTVKLAAVPMPPARPARPAATVVAAASSPAGIVAARGLWDADGGLKQISDPATFKVAMADAPASGALAYAPTAVVPIERKRGGSTSGASIRNVSATIRTQAVTTQPSFDDIWMRAIVLTPSLQNFMSVTMIGMNEKDLRPLMRKPTTALTMTFSDDPMGGIATERFNGESSVVFLDTVSFVTRTAFLRQ